MWGLPFGSLGWNFLEFGFTDGIDVGFIVCGVLFWAMALPAWRAMFAVLKNNLRTKLKLDPEGPERLDKKLAKAQARMWAAGSLQGSLWWWLIYGVLYAGGALFDVAIYAAAS